MVKRLSFWLLLFKKINKPNPIHTAGKKLLTHALNLFTLVTSIREMLCNLTSYLSILQCVISLKSCFCTPLLTDRLFYYKVRFAIIILPFPFYSIAQHFLQWNFSRSFLFPFPLKKLKGFKTMILTCDKITSLALFQETW